MRSTFPALMLAAGIALPAVGIAQPAPIKPGLWQMHLETDAIDPAKMREMEQQMKNMPPEQRQMMEQMMKGRGGLPGGAAAAVPKIQYRAAGYCGIRRERLATGGRREAHGARPELSR